ncbi:hypothetical protein BANRA_04293 [Escherichia coli]|nr:hypothetical protein BANRA_04293 [Escherichia coli]
MAGTASDDRAARAILKCFYTEYRDRTDTSAPERTTDNLSYRQPGALSLPYLATGAEYHCNVPRVFLATHPGNKTVYPHLSDD